MRGWDEATVAPALGNESALVAGASEVGAPAAQLVQGSAALVREMGLRLCVSGRSGGSGV